MRFIPAATILGAVLALSACSSGPPAIPPPKAGAAVSRADCPEVIRWLTSASKYQGSGASIDDPGTLLVWQNLETANASPGYLTEPRATVTRAEHALNDSSIPTKDIIAAALSDVQAEC